jgi:hypothetical protein
VTVCPAQRVLFYDEPEVVSLYREFGDFTLGYFYGIGWGEFAQRTLGSTLEGEQRALLNDCFTGAWVRDITPDRFGDTPRQGDRDGDGEDDTVTSSPATSTRRSGSRSWSATRAPTSTWSAARSRRSRRSAPVSSAVSTPAPP